MNSKDIERINELYRKKKAGALTPEEAEEQARLRMEYIHAIRENLRGTLNQTKIQYPDGRVVDLGQKYGHKEKKKN